MNIEDAESDLMLLDDEEVIPYPFSLGTCADFGPGMADKLILIYWLSKNLSIAPHFILSIFLCWGVSVSVHGMLLPRVILLCRHKQSAILCKS